MQAGAAERPGFATAAASSTVRRKSGTWDHGIESDVFCIRLILIFCSSYRLSLGQGRRDMLHGIDLQGTSTCSAEMILPGRHGAGCGVHRGSYPAFWTCPQG